MGALMSGTVLRCSPSLVWTLNRSAICCIAFRRALRAAITSGESSPLAARTNPHQHARQAKNRANIAVGSDDDLRFIILILRCVLAIPELHGSPHRSHDLRALPRIGRCDRGA